MKFCRLRALLAGVLCALLALPVRPAGAVSTSATAAILMDADSGRVLYAQNERSRLPIASTTKLMTALVACEHQSDLDVPVTVDPRAAGIEGSSMYLAAGEVLSLRELLYGLLLHSGNDAAVAIAIFCAGDVETFVDWMNLRAGELGMENTHFANPNGLDDPQHYSSAYDMALLARAILDHPALSEMAATRSITLGKRALTNHNKLLWRYEGCVGLKTGYTQTAGRTLVSAAHRDGATLIAVTLHDPNDWADHASLFDYGFAHYQPRSFVSEGQALALLPVWGSLGRYVPVVARREVRALLAPGETVTTQVLLPARLEAPVAQGQVVGQLIFRLDGRELGRTDLLAGLGRSNDRPGGLPGLLARPLIPLVSREFPGGLPVWRGPMSRIPL